MKDLEYVEEYIKDREYNTPELAISCRVMLEGKIKSFGTVTASDTQEAYEIVSEFEKKLYKRNTFPLPEVIKLDVLKHETSLEVEEEKTTCDIKLKQKSKEQIEKDQARLWGFSLHHKAQDTK